MLTKYGIRTLTDVVITKYGIRTLTDVVITNPTQTNLLPQFYTTQGFAASNTVQAKESNYHNQHPTDQFLPLVIAVFGCLHKHADVF